MSDADKHIALRLCGGEVRLECNEAAEPLGSHYTGVLAVHDYHGAVSMHVDLIEVVKVPNDYSGYEIRSICTDSGYQSTVDAYWKLNGDEPPSLLRFNHDRTYMLLIYPFAE